jgi:hypothetical protein
MVELRVNEQMLLQEVKNLENEFNEIENSEYEKVKDLDVSEETIDKIVDLIVKEKSTKCKEKLDYLKKFLMEVEVEKPVEQAEPLEEANAPANEAVANVRSDVPEGFIDVPKF